MLCEDSRVRLKGSTITGAVVGLDPKNDHCMVDPDPSLFTEGPTDPFEADFSAIDELIEANNQNRRGICDEFDLIRLYACVEICLDRHFQLDIERVNKGYLVKAARFLAREGGNELLLEGEDADRLREKVGEMKSSRWIDPFKPKGRLVLDGYSWVLEVYSGSRYYTCSGDNVTPQELLDFVDYVASLGLPRIDVFD